MQTWRIDYDYIKTLGMEIVRGRNFSKDFGSDSNAIINHVHRGTVSPTALLEDYVDVLVEIGGLAGPRKEARVGTRLRPTEPTSIEWVKRV